MNNIIKIILNWKNYKDWEKRVSGKSVRDFKRGAGYYFPTGMLGAEVKGRVDILNMESGKRALFKLIDYKMFNDPSDMIEWSVWQFLGYEREKMLSKMSFNEYLEASRKYNFKV